MNFELHNNTQIDRFSIDVKIKMYEKVNQCSKKTEWIRLTGPIIAVSSTLIMLVVQVVSTVECVIKGLANLFGSLMAFDKCSAKLGAKQLFIAAPLHLLGFILVPVHLIIGGLATSIGILVAPERYSEFRMTANKEQKIAAEELATSSKI